MIDPLSPGYSDCDDSDTSINPPVDISKEIHQRIGSLLLKLESVHNISGKCINDLVEELYYIYTAYAPVIHQLVDTSLKKVQLCCGGGPC